MLARLRSVWQGLSRRDQIEAEMAEEFRHHLELRAEDLIRAGLSPEEAARRARIEFGHIDTHKTDARQSRGLRLFDEIKFSALDVKLGIRMMMKYPGLSIVAVLGMAVAIAIGAGYYAGFGAFLDRTLPLDEGDRVVGLRYRGNRPGPNATVSVHDYLAWQAELGSVRELSAFQSQRRNLITAAGGIELVEVAAMTASGFRVARVSPAMGRPLLDQDERAGAAPVLVIAHEEWHRVFNGDPDIVGRTVHLGETVHTVVGVMPEGFRFPVNHRYWIPISLDASAARADDAPSLLVFGRLADGVTLEGASAELATVGGRMAVEFPATHARVLPTVLPYTQSMLGVDPGDELTVRRFRLAVSLLLVIVALNVAVLVYARTVTRAGEIAVRSALGASRRRVVTQLFVEGLVLSVVASAIGLTLAGVALGLVNDWAMDCGTCDGVARGGGELPFWFELGLSLDAVLYVILLTIVAGAIVGVLPALKATGKRLQVSLQQHASRGSAMQLGGMWSALIVVQVAVAVAALPAAVLLAEGSIRLGIRAPSTAAHVARPCRP